MESTSPQYAEFRRRTDAFTAEAARRGLGDVSSYFWYHAVDLGEGLMTPGSFDYRHSVSHFHSPADLGGAIVLDVGSATGCFAFEFERRGAEVVT